MRHVTALGELASLPLPARIRAVRRAAGLTQAEFGRVLGVDRSNVNGIERGKRGVGEKNAERVAAFATKVYGEPLPPELFMTRPPETQPLDAAREFRRLDARFDGLEARLEALERLLRDALERVRDDPNEHSPQQHGH